MLSWQSLSWLSSPSSRSPPPAPATGGSAPVCFLQKLQPVRTGEPPPARLFLERRRALSAGSAVFEGPPVPLIRPGTPRREQAPSLGPPHCGVLFLCPCSLHSVKLGGTSSISPVPHVNRRFNQTLLSGPLPPTTPPSSLPPAPHTHAHLSGKKSLGSFTVFLILASALSFLYRFNSIIITTFFT